MDKAKHIELFEKGLRLKKVVPIPESFSLSVEFSNGEHGMVNMEDQVQKKKSLAALQDPEFFTKCAIIHDGVAVGWPGDISTHWDTLYHFAEEQGSLMSGEGMTADEFRAWLKRQGYSQNSIAEVLGYSVRQINKFSTGKAPVPEVVRLACLAVEAGLGRDSAH